MESYNVHTFVCMVFYVPPCVVFFRRLIYWLVGWFNKYFIVWVYQYVFIHSSIGDHLGRFQFGDNISKAVMNICVHIFMWTCFQVLCVNTLKWNCYSVWKIRRDTFNFMRKCLTISPNGCIVFVATSNIWEVLFLHILANTWYYQPKLHHFNECALVSHCGFNLHFPNDW